MLPPTVSLARNSSCHELLLVGVAVVAGARLVLKGLPLALQKFYPISLHLPQSLRLLLLHHLQQQGGMDNGSW